MNVWIGFFLTFEFFPLIVCFIYLWLIRILKIKYSEKQLGCVLIFIGGLHLVSVFLTVPDKYQNDMVSQYLNLIENKAVTEQYREKVVSVCADSKLRAYEYRSLNKAIITAIHSHTNKFSSYTIGQQSTSSADFCLFSVRNADKLIVIGDKDVK